MLYIIYGTSLKTNPSFQLPCLDPINSCGVGMAIKITWENP